MCESVRFEVDGPFLGALYCHCGRCQRRSGSAYSITALSEPGTFRVTKGEELLRSWDPGDGWVKSFCERCGSHTHTANPDDPTVIATRLGCLDQDPEIRPSAHQFVSYALPWHPLPDDGLPRFPERLGTTPPLD